MTRTRIIDAIYAQLREMGPLCRFDARVRDAIELGLLTPRGALLGLDPDTAYRVLSEILGAGRQRWAQQCADRVVGLHPDAQSLLEVRGCMLAAGSANVNAAYMSAKWALCASEIFGVGGISHRAFIEAALQILKAQK